MGQDTAAIDRVFRRMAARLLRRYALWGRRHLLDDVVQEMWADVWALDCPSAVEIRVTAWRAGRDYLEREALFRKTLGSFLPADEPAEEDGAA